VQKDFELDHIESLSRGGANSPANLVVACPSCNRRKSGKHSARFASEIYSETGNKTTLIEKLFQHSIKEAAAIRYPMDKFIGVWWSASENDTLPAGDAADGYKAITFHGVGSDWPIYADLKKYVYDAGKSAGAGDQHGFVLYNRGMASAMWAAEAARTAQEIHGVKEITPAMMRDGFEALNVDEARLAELGLAGFTVAVANTCANHGGPGLGAIQQWNAKTQTWSVITDYMEADREVVDALIEEDSAAYAKENNITPRECN
jgi:branched-chain amino acid transport system substrate-binding protein